MSPIDPFSPQPSSDDPSQSSDGETPSRANLAGENPFASPTEPMDAEVLDQSSESPPQQLPPLDGWEPRKMGVAWAAWLVIVGVVAFIAARPLYMTPDEEGAGSGKGMDLVMLQMQGKVLIGGREWTPDKRQKKQFAQNLNQLNQGGVHARLGYAVLTGEIKGAEAALDALDGLSDLINEHNPKLSEEQRELRVAFDSLYRDYQNERWNAPSVSDAERKLIRSELGWLGALALSPELGPDQESRNSLIQSATVAAGGLMAVALIGIAYVGAGICLHFGFLFTIFTRTLTRRFRSGAPHHGVYAETFAVWMVGFFAFSIVLSLFQSSEAIFTLQLVGFFGSLIALAWPVIRGIPWRVIRYDIGWTWGKGVSEPFWGIACHAASLPLVIMGFAMMFALMAAFGPEPSGNPFSNGQTASHPIVEWMTNGSWLERIQIIIVACIGAPLVEETMFRGVLYRHLRDASAGARVAASVLCSVLFNSFIFAVIHPQGIFAVPVLGALAAGFSLAREWRGSIIAPVIAHALNNSVVMMILLLFLAG